MRRWAPRVVIATTAALVVFSAFLFRPTPDPIIQGKPISAWAEDLLTSDYTLRTEAQSTLLYAGPTAVPQLRKFLKRENRAWQKYLLKLNGRIPFFHYKACDAGLSRERAALLLAEFGPRAEGAVPDLIQCLKYPDTLSATEHALRRIGSVAEPALIHALRDKQSGIREAAARLLAQLQTVRPPAHLALINSLSDPAPTVRRQAALSLGELPSVMPNTDPALCKTMLEDRSPEVRERAAEALGKHKSAGGSLAALSRAMNDSSPTVRLQSAKAYWLITHDSEKVLPVLIHLLQTRQGWQANYVLGQMGPQAAPAIPALTQILRNERVPRPFRTPPSSVFALGQIGASAVPALTEILKDSDPVNRVGAVMALGLMRRQAKPALSALMELLRDKDPEVRHATALTLSYIGADSEPVIAGLADCLRDEDIYLRFTAAEILRQLAPSREWVVQLE